MKHSLGSGAATVLSFASVAELFAKETSGSANAALNLLHVGGAFLIQCLTGSVVALWPEQNGGHPTIGYQTAFAVNLTLQVAWFLLPSRASKTPAFLAHTIHWRPVARTQCLAAAGSYDRAIDRWMARIAAAREEAAAWRAAAIASALFALTLSASFAQAIAAQRMAGVHVVQMPDRFQTGLLFETEATQHWSGDRTPMPVITARMAPVVDDFDFGVANR